MVIKLILLFVAVVVVAAVSAAETALNYLARTRVVSIEEEGPEGDALSRVLREPTYPLATLVLLKTLALVTAVALVISAVGELLPQGAALPLALTATIVLLLIFAEFVPKTIAAAHLDPLGRAVANPVIGLTRVLYPLVWLLLGVSNLLVRLFGGTARSTGPFLTEEEIRAILAVGEAGAIQVDEAEMIHSIFEFGDTIVREVMVPRTDMVSLSSDTAVSQALKVIVGRGFSRIPIYEGDLDHITGILYAKDLLLQLSRGNQEMSISGLVRPAHFIPETKNVDELLKELQRRKTHMAIVVDEYGGTAGLVTIEDLLEEIVGEIFDEYDREEVLVERVDDQTMRVDARLPLDEASDLLGVELNGEDIDTIGGFVYNLIGKIPREGERLEYNNLSFLVERVQRHRIRKILVTRAQDQAAADHG